MPQQRTTRELDFSQRVITALTDLADLSRRTSMLRFTSPETLKQFATRLIQRLVALCDAWQGVLFLARSTLQQGNAQFQTGFANQSPFSLIAGAQISEEEACAALATYPVAAAPLHWSVDLPPTLVWRRSLDASGTDLAHAHPSANHLASQSYALLLFTWPQMSPRTQENTFREREQAMQLLPFLANTVDTILLHLLIALGENEQSEDPLPAELLATVGHEFRGPLTTISGYATTLLRHDQQLAPEERQDFLHAINQASTHLGKLVDRFLELAQFEANAVAFVPASVDLAALADEAMIAAKQIRGHQLILAPPLTATRSAGERAEESTSSNALTVSGDRRWLRTMLDILLENAIVYSPAGHLIEVSIDEADSARIHTAPDRPTDPDTHMALILPGAFEEHEALLEIRVRDHGTGIAPEHLERIFQRFYRVDTSLTREVNGLGLGLALCKAIVAWHRGMLWVESQIGEGSTFHILLPREGAPIGERRSKEWTWPEKMESTNLDARACVRQARF